MKLELFCYVSVTQIKIGLQVIGAISGMSVLHRALNLLSNAITAVFCVTLLHPQVAGMPET